MPDVTYPLDTTGISLGNLVTNEAHTLTEINSSTYNLIIPKFAPFYIDNFKLRHIDDTGVVSILNEGEHYNFALTYLGGSRSIGKAIYGGISIIDTLVNGYIEIDYQTLGGEWVADTQYVLTTLAEMVYNPRVTVWDVVTNIQAIFPPINHDNNFDYVYGQAELIAKLSEIVDAIVNSANSNIPLLENILNTIKVTRTTLGLDQIVDLPLATNAEVAGKQALDKYITLKQVVTQLLPNLGIAVNNSKVEFTTNVTSAKQVVDENSVTIYRTVKYVVQVTTANGYQSCELLLTHDGINAYITEYANIHSGNVLATFETDVIDGQMQLLVTPVEIGTSIKAVKQLVEV